MKLTEEQKQNITNEYNQWKDKQYAGKTLEQRKELDAFFTPPELTIQMIETFDSIENKSILDPTAGAGGLIAACILAGADPTLCYCNELDEDILKICKERLIPMGVPEENIHQGNALDPRCIEKSSFRKGFKIPTKINLW